MSIKETTINVTISVDIDATDLIIDKGAAEAKRRLKLLFQDFLQQSDLLDEFYDIRDVDDEYPCAVNRVKFEVE